MGLGRSVTDAIAVHPCKVFLGINFAFLVILLLNATLARITAHISSLGEFVKKCKLNLFRNFRWEAVVEDSTTMMYHKCRLFPGKLHLTKH